MEKYLELGQIVNTFGIRGQVKVKPFTTVVEHPSSAPSSK